MKAIILARVSTKEQEDGHSITLREPFKIIKDTSQLEKCPEICRSQDSFRTFLEFDWSSIDRSLLTLIPRNLNCLHKNSYIR